ncbi:MAG: phenylalanyl-tRNA synthetase alpha chain [Fimbriimonadaceae bacterium]|jgi:phenylalanyl-tRNA synthetase alpha chain|nr:phenylalanyl-tRNA synthetase alpha chain [Fimbriimonadaceae bacterium]
MLDIQELEKTATRDIVEATSSAQLREAELKYLGKSGLFTGLLKQIGALPAEERKDFGQQVNESKSRVQKLLETRLEAIRCTEREHQYERERIDVTLPGMPVRMGREHVLQQATNKIKDVFTGLGFRYMESPELEEFRYNFEALNYPPDHPAMDDQDSFYVTDDLVLRTQTTALQGRVYEMVQRGEMSLPLRVFTVGRNYRNEAVDRTHGHTFHQVDAFMIDEGISMADLKGTLGLFARAMFGEEVKVRFRPDFFPFVEPGVDYAISTPKLFDGKWVELGGAGLIHPNILERYGFDSERWSGFAFGLGVERIPMMAYGVDDLRNFLENDLRFLEQFPG